MKKSNISSYITYPEPYSYKPRKTVYVSGSSIALPLPISHIPRVSRGNRDCDERSFYTAPGTGVMIMPESKAISMMMKGHTCCERPKSSLSYPRPRDCLISGTSIRGGKTFKDKCVCCCIAASPFALSSHLDAVKGRPFFHEAKREMEAKKHKHSSKYSQSKLSSSIYTSSQQSFKSSAYPYGGKTTTPNNQSILPQYFK
ncbi:hypothetical protein ADUPG1_000444 [Aduncisulcus paluster]|uniref:Uncharacterized protein n=1 Tax=Aduncisulcus paluster TaxID=2918883 RepID=A0ABQ5KB56_9EUKA|nr:hypothetical protein ADUPG1_000444 [Aduncisulcus paluster]